MPTSANANIARHLALMAESQPDRAALKIPRGRTPGGEIDYLSLSFQGLAAEAEAWRAHLHLHHVRRGDRTLLMVKPGLPLIAAAFALFQLGAVPVIIDPGMGLKNFLACVARTKPRALVGIAFAQVASRLFRPSFRSIETRIWASSSLTAQRARATLLKSQIPDLKSEVTSVSAATDLAAILFTSGSTGAPKGVCYEHGMFEAQVNSIRETYGIQPGEIDLPMLPIFALFNPALGMTTVVPEIDPRHPAQVDPAKIVQAIQQERVTNSFGSPTLWRKIGDHCRAQKITLPTLRRVLCAGAPVPAALWQQSGEWLPRGLLHSPYGATEALPVSSIASHEVDLSSVGGACVGRPVAGIEAKVIAITDAPIPVLSDVHEFPPNQIGEFIVRGHVVTKTYDAAPEATALAKIRSTAPESSPGGARSLELGVSASPRGAVWHRMGDCGYVDAAGRLWFCGRKAERVETKDGTLHTEPCEQVFRAHPRVNRCALVGLGRPGEKKPAMVIEVKLTPAEAQVFARELRVLAGQYPHTAEIDTYYFHPAFPVDVRHNAKIHRLVLARWALTAPAYHGSVAR